MKKISSFLVLILLTISVLAQERAPLNPEFLNYVKNHDKTADKKSSLQNPTGYIPSPLYIHFNNAENTSNTKKSAQSLPSSFDLRDQNCVTSVKNQNPLGSCWTFASIGAIESSWIKKGLEPISLDLSEENMGTCHGFEFGINDGGNDLIAAAYLTRLDGPVNESDDPYTANPDATCPVKKIVKPAYAPTVDWLPKDIEIIKEAVYNYGAVTAAMTTDGFSSRYYSSVNNTFYYTGTNSVDHGVLIVGWDDDMEVTGGYMSPSTTGAWIVKNSWGSAWGDNGYFYAAYEDTRFLSSSASFPTRLETTDLDTMYIEDKLGATTSFGYREETAYGLVKYTAPYEQFITMVGTYINSSGSFVDVEIYDDLQGDTLLQNLLASSYDNLIKFPGYSTVDINAIVDGDFYIKVKYYTPGFIYPIPAETQITLGGELYADPHINNSGRFWISEDGEGWTALGADITDNEADLCIRAYAERNTDLNVYFTSDKQVSCFGSNVEFTEDCNGDITSYAWDFGAGATPATASTAGPHTVSYSTTGVKDVTLSITGPSGTKALTKTGYIKVVDELDVFLPYSEILLPEGKSATLVASGADNYSWSPSEGLNTTTGSTVIASPLDTITYTVVGTSATCTGSKSVTINVVEVPDNDDVCNAFEITSLGYIGLFDNYYASVEAGEPFPPEDPDGCDMDMYWCVEGGLQNSVWFTFIAPSSGIISVDAPGMDNQLALYKAVHCDSIFSPTGFEMVAAFDDYYPQSEFYAAALEEVTVIPGERYFLQVDGSAGGAEGEFDLYFYDYSLGIEDNFVSDNSHSLNIFPNPNKGKFELLLPDNSFGEGKLSLYDISGKLIESKQYYFTGEDKIEINLEGLDSGIYLVTLNIQNKITHGKLIIQ